MNKGQITPDSRFGQLLTQLASESNVMVEIGTWCGGGSTRCLVDGMTCPEQTLLSLDADLNRINEAQPIYAHDPRIRILHGTIATVAEMQSGDDGPYYDFDKQLINSAPQVLDAVPEAIDLLLIDGGEFTASAEFAKLHSRCKVIALDDTNAALAFKNVANRQSLLDMNWQVIADVPGERNGWFVARRP